MYWRQFLICAAPTALVRRAGILYNLPTTNVIFDARQ
jgi:hypothetical protein